MEGPGGGGVFGGGLVVRIEDVEEEIAVFYADHLEVFDLSDFLCMLR